MKYLLTLLVMHPIFLSGQINITVDEFTGDTTEYSDPIDIGRGLVCFLTKADTTSILYCYAKTKDITNSTIDNRMYFKFENGSVLEVLPFGSGSSDFLQDELLWRFGVTYIVFSDELIKLVTNRISKVRVSTTGPNMEFETTESQRVQNEGIFKAFAKHMNLIE